MRVSSASSTASSMPSRWPSRSTSSAFRTRIGTKSQVSAQLRLRGVEDWLGPSPVTDRPEYVRRTGYAVTIGVRNRSRQEACGRCDRTVREAGCCALRRCCPGGSFGRVQSHPRRLGRARQSTRPPARAGFENAVRARVDVERDARRDDLGRCGLGAHRRDKPSYLAPSHRIAGPSPTGVDRPAAARPTSRDRRPDRRGFPDCLRDLALGFSRWSGPAEGTPASRGPDHSPRLRPVHDPSTVRRMSSI